MISNISSTLFPTFMTWKLCWNLFTIQILTTAAEQSPVFFISHIPSICNSFFISFHCWSSTYSFHSLLFWTSSLPPSCTTISVGEHGGSQLWPSHTHKVRGTADGRQIHGFIFSHSALVCKDSFLAQHIYRIGLEAVGSHIKYLR